MRKVPGFMGAGPLARSACPLMKPGRNLVHAALELLQLVGLEARAPEARARVVLKWTMPAAWSRAVVS
jgi:hypothetical protein